MTLEEIILKINERVPAAENMADIQRAFIDVLKDLKPSECYSFIQTLLVLNHYRVSTRGLWATDMIEFINEHREKLFKLEFTEMPGWIGKGQRLSAPEDETYDDE